MSSVSRATSRRASSGACARNRSVCVRLARRMSTTRMSSTIASSILRSTSACGCRVASFWPCAARPRVTTRKRFSFDTPATSAAMVGSNCGGEPLLGILEVLGDGEEKARRARRPVQAQRRQVRGNAKRVIDRRLAGAELLVRVERHDKVVRPDHERTFGCVEPGEPGLEAGRDDGAGSGCDGNHCRGPSGARNVTGRP